MRRELTEAEARKIKLEALCRELQLRNAASVQVQEEKRAEMHDSFQVGCGCGSLPIAPAIVCQPRTSD